MKRNLDNRVETVVPVLAAHVREQIETIIEAYEQDNCSVWECGPDGTYTLRAPARGEPRRTAQETLARRLAPGRGGEVIQISGGNR